mmetsp:Transcript_58022/g.135804  ORF Transcript_58022/g.135804 Transcript_58022/m.135804 type:complete len:211 (+) Transcript_58022:957-1589(+)
MVELCEDGFGTGRGTKPNHFDGGRGWPQPTRFAWSGSRCSARCQVEGLGNSFADKHCRRDSVQCCHGAQAARGLGRLEEDAPCAGTGRGPSKHRGDRRCQPDRSSGCTDQAGCSQRLPAKSDDQGQHKDLSSAATKLCLEHDAQSRSGHAGPTVQRSGAAEERVHAQGCSRENPEDLASLVQVLPRQLGLARDNMDSSDHDPGKVAMLSR